MTYEGLCKGGPLNGQSLAHNEPVYRVMKHPGTFFGEYKFIRGYEGIWAWFAA